MRAGALVVVLMAAPLLGAEIILEADGAGEGAEAFAFAAGGPPVSAAAADGVFRFAGLDPGTYNIEIKAGALDVIGVDLRPRDAQGAPVEAGEVPAGVEKTVREFFEHTKDFFDRRRMPLMAGTAEKVVALVENIRSGDETTFREGADKVFFRLDLWEFEKSFGSWRKTGSRVFLRRLAGAGEFEKTRFVYTGALGGIDLAEGALRRIKYAFPADEDTDCEVEK